MATRRGSGGRGGGYGALPGERTPAEERAIDRDLALLKMESELTALKWSVEAREGLPKGWSEVDRTVPTRPRRQKVTLLLDEDMLRWWRKQGEGYQARINAVLRLYLTAKVSGKI